MSSLLGNPYSFKNFLRKTDTDSSDEDSSFSSDEEDTTDASKQGPPLLPNPLQEGPPLLPDPLQEGLVLTKKAITEPAHTKDIFSKDSSEEEEDINSLATKLHEIPLSDPLQGGVSDHTDEDGCMNEEGPLDMNPFPEVAMLTSDETHHQLVSELNKVPL